MTKFHRRPDWPQVLAAEIDAAQRTPFAWGRHDCCLWALKVIDALIGSEISAVFAGRYTTRIGAARCILEYGRTLEGAGDRIAMEFGGASIPVLMAQRGDCVLADVRDPEGVTGPALGICVGERGAFVGPDGLTMIPIKSCRRAWRV